jgi:hypothetical protein
MCLSRSSKAGQRKKPFPKLFQQRESANQISHSRYERKNILQPDAKQSQRGIFSPSSKKTRPSRAIDAGESASEENTYSWEDESSRSADLLRAKAKFFPDHVDGMRVLSEQTRQALISYFAERASTECGSCSRLSSLLLSSKIGMNNRSNVAYLRFQALTARGLRYKCRFYSSESVARCENQMIFKIKK